MVGCSIGVLRYPYVSAITTTASCSRQQHGMATVLFDCDTTWRVVVEWSLSYVFTDTYACCGLRMPYTVYIRTYNTSQDVNFVNAPLHEDFRCFVYTSPCVPEDFVNDSFRAQGVKAWRNQTSLSAAVLR